MRVRKNTVFSMVIAQGLTTYIPPSEKDFEVLEKTNTKPKTNMKGEPKKFERKLARSPAKFPLRTLEIGEQFLSCNQEFFEMHDFICLMFVLCVVLFLITSTIHVLPFSWCQGLIQTSLTYYMTLLVLVLILQSLTKNTFNLGWFQYTDETKMEIFMAVKGFVFTYCTFNYLDSRFLFDYDLAEVHKEFNERLNQALAPFGVQPRAMPFDATVFVFAICAALLSFVMVRISIKFAYFLYVFTSSKEYDDVEEREDTQAERTSKRINRIVKLLLYANFLFPLFVILIYINPLIKALLVPDTLSDGTF
jgi:hypothetical protein